MAKQKKEAVLMVNELDLLDTANSQRPDTVERVFEEFQVDPECSFEPKAGSKKRQRGRPKKPSVSVYDESDVSSNDERRDASDKRPDWIRKRPSKDFVKSLEKTIKQRRTKVESLQKIGETKCYDGEIRSENSVCRPDGKKER
ncbi:Hypothetical predicted protein [Paramuricea clavata]|uniref:Uncharacterized protein n=1 Tax=Paramuricea clavata TaxID=317549 RepID=A0A7D9JMT8_PARCT|nr:Hypothetical predicted protein [Paramuricea clavata]